MNETTGKPAVPSIYAQALRKAISDLNSLSAAAGRVKFELLRLETEIEAKRKAINALSGLVPAEDAFALRSRARKAIKENPSPTRSSVLYDVVRNLIKNQVAVSGDIKTGDVLSKVNASGLGVDPKAVYNTLNYMNKIGKLRRVGRGRYLVVDGGYGFHTTHEVGATEEKIESESP